MPAEARQCQNCRNRFVIEPEDFEFYEKIKVPPPTWCPECRLQRRMIVSNERALYKTLCALCGKEVISMYGRGSHFPVYCMECWRSDKLDGVSLGQLYDFSRSFFEQFRDLKKLVPRVALLQHGNMTRSEYANRSSNDNDCYLVFRSNFDEKCLYGHTVNDSKDSIDCLNVQKSELVYEGTDCFNCYNLKYSRECKNCQESLFLYDCRNCSNCFGCAGLRNKQYYIFNNSYSKEAYFKKIQSFGVENYESLEGLKERFSRFIQAIP